MFIFSTLRLLSLETIFMEYTYAGQPMQDSLEAEVDQLFVEIVKALR